ncbi:MAG: Rsd/AlgQ family anti-sigma factor [Porticoccaceae bacterium]|jgi:regulator of sigma D|nr:Rsd/AlgQ family anti-sigma factor [Porticoccaceae bacterium]
MLNQSQQALQRWKGFDEAIDRWLEERHQLIVLLSDFATRRDFDVHHPQLARRLAAFRSLLIDYISAGHFEFYQRLLDEGREFHDEQAVALGGKLLLAIEGSTQLALAFDEKYDAGGGFAELEQDLSALAESLVARFGAEDQMIRVLHDAHLAGKTA